MKNPAHDRAVGLVESWKALAWVTTPTVEIRDYLLHLLKREEERTTLFEGKDVCRCGRAARLIRKPSYLTPAALRSSLLVAGCCGTQLYPYAAVPPKTSVNEVRDHDADCWLRHHDCAVAKIVEMGRKE